MIKELVFAGEKWWEGEGPNYIGKTITQPPQIPISKYKALNTVFVNDDVASQSALKNARILGQVNALDQHKYLFVSDSSLATYWINLDSLFTYGGGIS